MVWMKKPKEKWSCKRSFRVMPKEKMRKDMLAARLVRIYRNVFAAVYKWRKKVGAK
jgi:hypothetical protein